MYSFSVNTKRPDKVLFRKSSFFGIELGLPITLTPTESRNFDICLKPYLLKFDMNDPITFYAATLEFGYKF